jgi:hypothetical protein
MGVGYAEYGRERAEVIVDTATHLACASVGCGPTGSRSRGRLGGGRAVEAVTEFAKTIDALAGRVGKELAVDPAPVAA